jgi:uncharacterized protein (TIGR02145 family)
MSHSEKNEAGLVHVGSVGLAKVQNALQLTENLINSVDSVVIGNQEWMTRNLNVSRFRNGDVIPEVSDANEWARAAKEGEPAWCFVDESDNWKMQERLYNWHAVNDPRGLAPKGWRVANFDDWRSLVVALGGKDIAGQKMRSGNSRFWEASNVVGTNEGGFLGEPFGWRNCVGSFLHFGWCGYWWLANESSAKDGRCISLFFSEKEVRHKPCNKCFGMSVRCVKSENIRMK